MRESFVEDLLRKSVLQRKVAARLRLYVLCWCTSKACKHSISAIVIAAAMTSCSTAILGIERFTSAWARKVYGQMVALIQRWVLFFAETFRSFWSLKHSDHLSHSCIKTRRNRVFSPIFSDILTEMTPIFSVISKSFRSMTEKKQILSRSLELHYQNFWNLSIQWRLYLSA